MAKNKKSPLKAWWTIPAIIGGGLALSGISKARRRDRANRAELNKYNKQFDKRLKDYEKSEFQPLDVDSLRQENLFADQENIFEELEVDTQAADYAREQFQQQQANIMQGLRGTAGASGIAGLAQSLSGQATQQARETQATIGQQLQQNRRLKLTEQSRLKQMELVEQSRINQADRQILIANMEGARQFELDKMSTLIGVSGQKIAGAQGSIASRQQMYGQIAGAVGNVAGAIIPGIKGFGTW